MEKIINLINFEMNILKKKNIIFNTSLFLQYEELMKKSNSYYKNILFCLNNHYFFIKNENLEKEFLTFHNNLEQMFLNSNHFNNSIFAYRILKENDIFILTMYYIFNKDINLLTTFYVSIIYKSILFSSYDIKENFEGYKNSDQILNKACELYENFLIFFNINSIYNLKWTDNEIRSHLFAIFEYLVKENLILVKINWIKDQNLNTIKSQKLWKIKTYYNIELVENELNLILEEPYISNYGERYFIIGGYYSNMFEIFRKNPNSDYTFKFKNFQYIEKVVKQQWFVDINWFDRIIEIMKSENIDINNLKNKIDKNIILLKNSNWKDVIIQKEISKDIRYYTILIYYNMLKKYEINQPIYFPVFFDFRGRMYYNSPVSITNNRILRTLYYYGEYLDIDFIEDIDDIYINILNKYNKEIYDIINKYNIKIKTKKVEISLLFLLISIGKFNINKDKGVVHMDDFIKNGILYLEKKLPKPEKIEDLIEIENYVNIIKNNDFKKKIIIKDFTASFFQHLTRLLGPKDINTLKLSNMTNDLNWYDPYSYILKKYLESSHNNYSKYFKRSSIKKTIMTIPYSVGENTAWSYFKEEINYENEDLKNIRKEYKNFFNYAKNMLDNEFFNTPSWKIILFAICQAKWFNKIEIELDKASAHLIYFEKKKKILDLVINVKGEKIRITKKINTIDKTKIDYESITKSIRANWIAVLDADFLRKLNKLNKKPFYTIHDCVLVDWLNVDKLVINCNELMKDNKFENIKWDNKNDYKVFSFFIIF